MRRNTSGRNTLWLTGLAGAVAIGAWAFAGEIDPPSGPVASTMRTLDEVYAVAAAAGTGNAGCAPGLVGMVGTAGSCVIPGLPANMPDPTFEVFSFTQTASKPPPLAGGGGIPRSTIGEFVLTKPVDRTSIGVFRALTAGTEFGSVTVTLNDAGGTPQMTVTLKNCRITSRTAAMRSRCDGSTVASEELSLTSALVRYTDAVTGQYWEYNFDSQTGIGG
ncbi:MAG: type VI secretion system tube protein Hcp [Planctomycetes bacterium]|nr:type VI secretion system tube protein Hcp [Planctomycetota bacterium]